ncbi:MAG: tetraacyldisaccharide 4'-kinase [Proteobacteria bacterium]|nr:tetraacyldisaccharide 4'-kinase [Pseudomonadota bacterium]
MKILKNKPPFWNRIGIINVLLLPFSLLWWLYYRLNCSLNRPYKSSVPVVCIGNINIGGSHKTPTTMAIARYLQAAGKKVAILTRGYGKRQSTTGVIVADPQVHTADDVGDEALLLSHVAPTYVCANRALSARAATADGTEILLMDDGMQNNTLHKDYTIMMITAGNQFGNGLLLPSGPLRQTIKNGCSKANAFLLINAASPIIISKYSNDKPLYVAQLQVKNPEIIRNQKCVGVCAIADPDKFWHSLETNGAKLLTKLAFPDHHRFTEMEIANIFTIAGKLQAQVVTTSKDIVKFPKDYRAKIKVLELEVILPIELMENIMKLLPAQ